MGVYIIHSFNLKYGSYGKICGLGRFIVLKFKIWTGLASTAFETNTPATYTTGVILILSKGCVCSESPGSAGHKLLGPISSWDQSEPVQRMEISWGGHWLAAHYRATSGSICSARRQQESCAPSSESKRHGQASSAEMGTASSHAHFLPYPLLKPLGFPTSLSLANRLHLLAPLSFLCIFLAKAQPWMDSAVCFLYISCAAVEHCWKTTHPADGTTVNSWSPTPSGPLLPSGGPSLLPWTAHAPILLFFYQYDNRSSSRIHWVPTLDTAWRLCQISS